MPRAVRLQLILLLVLPVAISHAVEPIDGDNPAALTALGNEAAQSLQYDRAIALYRRALNRDPNYVYAIFNLGVVHQQRQELDRALDFYSQVLQVLPDHAQARNNSGIIAFERRDYRLAISHFSAAANAANVAAQDTATYFFNLGTAHEALSEWDLAIRAYTSALGHHPRHFGAHFNLGTLYLERVSNPTLAEQHLLTAHTIAPDDIGPLLNLGILGERHDRGKDPESWYNEAVRVAPPRSHSLATALWRRANFYNRLSPPRRRDLKQDLQVILDIDDGFPGANGLLGLYYESLAEYDLALEHLEKEVAENRFDRTSTIDLECLFVLSQIYTDHRPNLNRALHHARRYNEHRPDSAAGARLSERLARQRDQAGGGP